MDERLRQINRTVKAYDPTLLATRRANGMIMVLRRGDRLAASDFNQSEPELTHLNPQFILALTDTWKVDGIPVNRGLEPLLQELRSRDGWNDPNIYRDLKKRREQKEEDQARARKNEFRAIAADARKDFAKATNDINTSILEKTDNRRKNKWA